MVFDSKSPFIPPAMTEPDRNAEPPQRLEQLDRLRELARRRESAREAGNAPPPAACPGWRFLRHPAHCIALGFGSELAPMAAGTASTLSLDRKSVV